MSECTKIGSQDLTKCLLKSVERLFGFHQALLQVLNACSVVSNPRWEYHFVRQDVASYLTLTRCSAGGSVERSGQWESSWQRMIFFFFFSAWVATGF